MTLFALVFVGRRIAGIDQISVAQLWAHMTPAQIDLAVQVRVDGESIRETAEKNSVSTATVNRAVKALKTTLTRLNLSLPPKHKSNGRHVRQMPDKVARML